MVAAAALLAAAVLPHAVVQRPAQVRVAVVDTGAAVATPELAARRPLTWDVRTRSRDVADSNGHGTFVASVVAATSGDARLLIVKAANGDRVAGSAEAAAIDYAVDHGARIVNLSLAGPTTSPAERAAIRRATRRGVLLVAAAGNDYAFGNPVEYPAALLQPVGSNGRAGAGLVVAAAAPDGSRAPFSNTGSWISLAAPGVDVYGARPHGGHLYESGTSFAAAQVSGAAALVWAANPRLKAAQVAAILEQTASGAGAWTPALGYGVIDVAAAVARARLATP